MKSILFLLITLSFGLSGPAAHAQVENLFEEANKAYAEGNFEAAVKKYEHILESGQTAVEVHYNLGNAYYKLNQVGPSIYHYEKALQLDPGDPDIRNNLQFAQNMTVDAIEPVQQNRFARWWNSFLETFSTTGWAYAGILCVVVFVLLFMVYYFSEAPVTKRIFFISGMVFLFLGISCVAFGFALSGRLENENFAIVFSEEVGITSEPNERSEELFYLHEGAKVEVVEDFQEWYKIQLPNGNQGWVRREAIKNL